MKTTVDNTFGVLYIAAIISAMCATRILVSKEFLTQNTVGTLQFWMYIRRYHSKDPVLVKCLDVYKYLGRWQTAKFAPVLTNGHQLPASRILRYSLPWSGSIAGESTKAVIHQLGVVCLFGQMSYISVELMLLSEVITLKAWGIASNILAAVTDLTISVVLVILLHSVKTGFKRSTDLINRLGCQRAFALWSLLLPAYLFPRHPWHCKIESNFSIFFFLLMGRLYTNSMLVTLNSREYIKSSSERATRDQYSFENVDRSRIQQSRPEPPIAIRIDRVQDVHGDVKSQN
ncbi:hypothetical protein C8R43DRAFT_946782 [Mycena crocata]|nr:hypothetical protein C8R43DRAFT_946782 [Mycena crocata]